MFGGRIGNEGDITESLNKELVERWGFSVTITERLWWNEEIKVDTDQEEKRFVYLDAVCSVASGQPAPGNANEILQWVSVSDLHTYDINPPTRILLQRLGYVD